MNRFDFTPYRRNTVGFDRLFELLETTGRSAQNENYPPFNIERTGENDYQITVAVAGFKTEEIDIVAQQNLLIVTGSKQSENNDNRDFLHMGIATRNFERRSSLPTTSISRMRIWLTGFSLSPWCVKCLRL